MKLLDQRLGAPPVGPADASVYVHFPYCAKKCSYCDFNSHAVPHDDIQYADAILRELDARGSTLEAPRSGLSSVYFGGGTPSRWAPRQVGRVLEAIAARFGLRADAEISLEVNPGTTSRAARPPHRAGSGSFADLEPGRLEAYRAQGINRFSIGCQSFSDEELRTLGRIHAAKAGRSAVREAKATGAAVSLDLIYGLPNQSTDAALASVDAALELGPDHVSAYTLTVEPDTALAEQVRLGRFRPMPDDGQADLIEVVTARLEAAAFQRYEVSSYARDHRVSLHNTLYWLGGAYLGLGAGAHSYLPQADLGEALRRENVRSPELYLRSSLRAEGPRAAFEEKRAFADIVADRLMVVFRTGFGLDLAELEDELGPERIRQRVLLDHLERATRQGYLERQGRRFVPTPKGFLFNDQIARTMLEAAREVVLPVPCRTTERTSSTKADG